MNNFLSRFISIMKKFKYVVWGWNLSSNHTTIIVVIYPLLFNTEEVQN